VSNALGTGTTNPGLIQTAANTTPTGVLTSAGVTLPPTSFKVPVTDLENLTVNSGNGLWTFDPNLRVPYVQQWSLGIEREIANNTAFEVRYVGNHAVKIFRAVDINEVNIFENGFLQEFLNAQKNLAANGGSSFAFGGPGTVPLPIFNTLFAGVANSSAFGSSTFITQLNNNNVGAMAFSLANSPTYSKNRANLTLNGQPAPNFFLANPNAGFARALVNGSYSNYHSLQAEIRRRMSKGLQLQANYTFSKALTDTDGGGQSTLEQYRTFRNLSFDKHRAGFDQTHRFIGNFIYELPFGSGRRWLNGGIPVLGKAIEGWQVGSIISWQTGGPIGVFSGRSTFNQFNTGLNPAQLVGISAQDFANSAGIFKTPAGVFFFDPKLLDITTNPTTGQLTGATLKNGLLAAPAPGTLGNFPRNLINSPNFSQVDISLTKITRFYEKANVEFKANFINAFNHPSFAFADLNFDNANFGRINSVRGSERQINFILGINF